MRANGAQRKEAVTRQDFDFEAHGLDPDRFLTRRGIAELAERVLGIPFPESTMAKLATRGAGPPVDAVIGTRYLTRTRNAVAYVLGQLREPPRGQSPTVTTRCSRRSHRTLSTPSR